MACEKWLETYLRQYRSEPVSNPVIRDIREMATVGMRWRWSTEQAYTERELCDGSMLPTWATGDCSTNDRLAAASAFTVQIVCDLFRDLNLVLGTATALRMSGKEITAANAKLIHDNLVDLMRQREILEAVLTTFWWICEPPNYLIQAIEGLDAHMEQIDDDGLLPEVHGDKELWAAQRHEDDVWWTRNVVFDEWIDLDPSTGLWG